MTFLANGKSTVETMFLSNVLKVDDKPLIETGMCVGCILIDLFKDFDSLPHGPLVAKLFAYGISIGACTYIINYLRNRQQAVKLGNIKSEWLDIKTGVPQGPLFGHCSLTFST